LEGIILKNGRVTFSASSKNSLAWKSRTRLGDDSRVIPGKVFLKRQSYFFLKDLLQLQTLKNWMRK